MSAYSDDSEKVQNVIQELRSRVNIVKNQRKLTSVHKLAYQENADFERVVSENNACINKSTKFGLTPLHLACYEGKIDLARVLMHHGARSDKGDIDDWTPLHLAALQGHAEIARLLLDHIKDKNVLDKNDTYTPLHLACACGHLRLADMLLDYESRLTSTAAGVCAERGPGRQKAVKRRKVVIKQLESTTADGLTALHIACQCGQADVVRLLLEKGADCTSTDLFSRTPLSWAACEGHGEVLNLLIERGTDVNYSADTIFSPIVISSERGHLDVVKTLLDNGADVNFAPWDERTALHCASQRGHLEIVRLLLNRDADVGKTDEEGWTPLHCAVGKSHPEIARVLIEGGAEVDAKLPGGGTPLMLACENGNKEMAEILLDSNADIELATEQGITALHSAIQEGHVLVVKLLIDRGAAVNVATVDGMTALMMACDYRNADLTKLLIEMNAAICARDNDGLTCLHHAVQTEEDLTDNTNGDTINSEHVDHKDDDLFIDFLVSCGAEVNSADDDGLTPIHYAAKAGRTADVLALVKNGAFVSRQSADGSSPLMLAARAGRRETVQKLVELGADIWSTSNQNLSAAQMAILSGHTEVHDSLMSLPESQTVTTNMQRCNAAGGITNLHDAVRSGQIARLVEVLTVNRNVDITDFEGNTPLHIAASVDLSLTKLLIEHGADINRQNVYGISALHAATACGIADVVDYLIEHGADISVTDNWRLRPCHYGSQVIYENSSARKATRMRLFESHRQHSVGAEVNSISDKLNSSSIDDLGNVALHRLFDMRTNQGVARIVKKQSIMVKQLLTDHPRDIDVQNIFGHTPFHLVSNPQLFTSCFPFLRKQSFTCKDKRGRNFWHFLLRSNHAKQLAQQLLPVFGADCLLGIQDRDDRKRTPLHYSAMYANGDWVLPEAKHERNQIFDYTDQYSRQPIAYAAMNSSSAEKFNELLPISETQWRDVCGLSVTECKTLSDGVSRDVRTCKEQFFKFSRKSLRNFSDFIKMVQKSDTLDEICLRCCDDEETFIWSLWQSLRYDYNETSRLLSKIRTSDMATVSLAAPASDHCNLEELQLQPIVIEPNENLLVDSNVSLDDCTVFDDIKEAITDAIRDLMLRVSRLDERFEGKLELAGSMFEDTKVDCCDEFDFLVTLTHFSDICKVIEGLSPAYVRLTKRNDVIYTRLPFEEFFNKDGFLDVHLVKFRFEVLIKLVLSQTEFHKHNDTFEFVDFDSTSSIYSNFSADKPSFNLKVKVMKQVKNHFIFHEISIDIVPAICVKHWWPTELTDSSNLVRDACKMLSLKGCHLIFDQPHRKFPWQGFSQTHARVDFAMIESCIIRTRAPVVRAAYMVTKKIVKNFYRRTLFKSYVLKAVVMRCLKENPTEQIAGSCYADIDQQELVRWVQLIMRCLLDFVLLDYVPCFALPSFVLPVCHFERFVKFTHQQLRLRNLCYGDLVNRDIYERERNKPNGYLVENIAESYIYTHTMYWSVLPKDAKHELFHLNIADGNANSDFGVDLRNLCN